jgi:glycerophosphoryl diester phosphodiesterase
VNDPAEMNELISWGVDGIITDRPDLLLETIDRP